VRGISLLRPPFKLIVILLLASLAVPGASPQNPAPGAAKPKSSPTKPEITVVTSVRVVVERVFPRWKFFRLDQRCHRFNSWIRRPRLVIDLLHAQMGLQQKKIEVQQENVQQENIVGIRAEQFQKDPPSPGSCSTFSPPTAIPGMKRGID